MKPRAPELSALMTILRLVGPVISTRRSCSASGTGATLKSSGAVMKSSDSPTSSRDCTSSRVSSKSRRLPSSASWSRPTSASAPSVRTSSYRSSRGARTCIPSPPRQLLVGDPMWPVCLRTQAGPSVLLICLEIALEPDDLRVALEGQDVGRDAVQEPAVVRDDHRAAGEREQRLLERAQGVDVQVVRRLVEKKQVAAAAQQLREVHAVALSTGQRADLPLLVRAAEVEPGRIGT